MKKVLFLLIFLIIGCGTTASQQVVTAPIDLKFWVDFQQEWIDLDADQYEIYIFHNMDEFKAAPENIKEQGVEKWQAFYLEVPWPPDNPPPKNSAHLKPTNKQAQEGAKFIIEGVLSILSWKYLW